MTTYAIMLLMLGYAFVVSWSYTRYFPNGAFQFESPILWIQALEGFVNGDLLGWLLSVTVLTPTIVVLALLRLPFISFAAYLALALLASVVGSTLASPSPQYLTPFWNVVVGASVSVVPLTVWAILLISIIGSLGRS
jgi:hypothetical protein